MHAYSLSGIVSGARQFTRTAKLSLAEVLFIFSHTQLNEVEKILWILLTTHADENFYCSFSYAQLSFCLNITTEKVHAALKRLIAMGFLDTEDMLDSFTHLQLMKRCRFSVQLPLEGLLALKKASAVAAKAAMPCKPRRPITINLLNDRLC